MHGVMQVSVTVRVSTGSSWLSWPWGDADAGPRRRTWVGKG